MTPEQKKALLLDFLKSLKPDDIQRIWWHDMHERLADNYLNPPKIKVIFRMVNKETGGFDTGITRWSMYTEEQVKSNLHFELIEGLPAWDGCKWEYRIDRE